MSASNTNQKASLDLYERVTNRIISLLEAGTPPWRRTWGQYGLARNYGTKHVYTGINMVLLNMIAPYPIPYYLTWNQIQEFGGRVKQGSKAEWVYFYTAYYKDEHGNAVSEKEAEHRQDVKAIRFLKCYKVFNVECIEGIDFAVPEMPYRGNDTIDNCEELINSMREIPQYRNVDGQSAFYSPADDFVNVPNIKCFENSNEFYKVTFHEIVHWTGHGTRLARPGVVNFTTFGTDPYAEEELIAEMGASYLCAITGIDQEQLMENNAAYIQGWLKKLRGDSRLVFRAAVEAQRAVNFIVGSEVAVEY